jgi:hypothetical protein
MLVVTKIKCDNAKSYCLVKSSSDLTTWRPDIVKSYRRRDLPSLNPKSGIEHIDKPLHTLTKLLTSKHVNHDNIRNTWYYLKPSYTNFILESFPMYWSDQNFKMKNIDQERLFLKFWKLINLLVLKLTNSQYFLRQKESKLFSFS